MRMMHALPGHIGEVIHKVIAEYKTFNETDNEMIGAMAYTVGVQRSRIMFLERKVQELQKGRTPSPKKPTRHEQVLTALYEIANAVRCLADRI